MTTTKEAGDNTPICVEHIHLCDTKPKKKEQEYDPYQSPPDLALAKKHGQAKKVYVSKKDDKYEEEGREICICCGNPVVGEKIPLTAGLDKLYHLGSGFALYFTFIKYCIGLLMLLFATSGLYNLITNIQEGDCSDENVVGDSIYCVKGYILSFTIANKKDHEHLLNIQLILNLVSVILIMIFFHYLRYKFRRLEVEADDKTITPADYTVVVEGVPTTTKHKDIVNWVQGFAPPGQPFEIIKIIRPRDITEYIRLTAQKNTLMAQLNNLKGRHVMTAKDKENQKTITGKVDKLNHALAALKNKNAIGFCSIVYITFKTAQQADCMKKKFSKPWYVKAFGDIMSTFVKTSSTYEGHRVDVKRAPEPSDILWENLGYTPMSRRMSRIFTLTLTIIVILISFALVILLNWAQQTAVTKYGKKSPTVQGLSIVVSVIIVITNTILSLIIDFLARYEKHLTYTYYLKGVAEKLAVAQFFNTALTSLFSEIILSDNKGDRIQNLNFYSKGGLLETIFWVFITSAFLAPVLTIVDPMNLFKKFKRYRAEKQGDNLKMYQKDAHLLYEGPNLAMPAKYAAMIKIMLLTTFYAPAIPFSMIFTIIGLTMSYWAEKYTFLRRNVLPNSIDDGLCDAMVEYLEWAALTFAVGNIMYVKTLRNSLGEDAFSSGSTVLMWVTFGISLFHIFFPMESLNEKLFPIDDEVTENQTYEQVRLDFNTDYERENPLTRAKAVREFWKRVRGIQEDDSPTSKSPATAAYRKDNRAGLSRNNEEAGEKGGHHHHHHHHHHQEGQNGDHDHHHEDGDDDIDFDDLDVFAQQAQSKKERLNARQREEQEVKAAPGENPAAQVQESAQNLNASNISPTKIIDDPVLNVPAESAPRNPNSSVTRSNSKMKEYQHNDNISNFDEIERARLEGLNVTNPEGTSQRLTRKNT